MTVLLYVFPYRPYENAVLAWLCVRRSRAVVFSSRASLPHSESGPFKKGFVWAGSRRRTPRAEAG